MSYLADMNGVVDLDSDNSEFVEVDPTERYGRYNEILGKGASKTVYRAFDEYEGIEVAWNQVKLHDLLQSPEDLERLYSEIHLLKTLKHRNIMKFYTSWVDIANRNINFVTEMFTSGTLRQYRLKHKRVNTRAIKHWCRQILQGLLYLHSHDPPVIHRDLKCDNIFINGNQGEVKLGDLGLAAILRKSYAARCVGTPEFMAPEVYEEEYNELVDIYSFGMCILEMVTLEYPYSECSHPAQIYKKVISGMKPDALYKVKDPEVRQFVEKCLATVSDRHSAWELLNDPFLQIDDYAYDLKPLNYNRDCNEINPVLRRSLSSVHLGTTSSLVSGYSNHLNYEQEHDFDSHTVEYEARAHDFFTNHVDCHLETVGITIEGRKGDEDDIFLKLRIADKEGRIRNIYFSFGIEIDTALSVATEMVSELDITDQDVTKIAEMIESEIASLVPEWKRVANTKSSFCQNCASDISLVGYRPGQSRQHVSECSEHKCGAIHGRFEEITYQSEASEQYVTDCAPMWSSESDGTCYTDLWAQKSDPDFHFCVFGDSHDGFEQSRNDTYENIITTGEEIKLAEDDGENEIRQELRWIKDKYQMELRERSDQELGLILKNSSSDPDREEHKKDSMSLISGGIIQETGDESGHKSFYGKHSSTIYPFHPQKNDIGYESAFSSCSSHHMATAKGLNSGTLLPHHGATPLAVDATDL